MVCSTRSLIGYCYLILAKMIRLHRVRCSSGIMQLWLLLWHYLGVGQVGWVSFFRFLLLWASGSNADQQEEKEEQGERKAAGRKYK